MSQCAGDAQHLPKDGLCGTHRPIRYSGGAISTVSQCAGDAQHLPKDGLCGTHRPSGTYNFAEKNSHVVLAFQSKQNIIYYILFLL